MQCKDDRAEHREVFHAVRMCSHRALIPVVSLNAVRPEFTHGHTTREDPAPAVNPDGSQQEHQGPRRKSEKHPDRYAHVLPSTVRFSSTRAGAKLALQCTVSTFHAHH